MIWRLEFEKKPFQIWREIWIQVVVILLQLYLVINSPELYMTEPRSEHWIEHLRKNYNIKFCYFLLKTLHFSLLRNLKDWNQVFVIKCMQIVIS